MKNIYSSYINRKWRKKVNLLGAAITFKKSVKVIHSYGANADNIVLHDNVCIAGTLWAKAQGTIRLCEGVSIGEQSLICAASMISIGAGTAVGCGTTIADHDLHDKETDSHDLETYTEPVVIGRNCKIGSNVVIKKGVIIADNSIIPDNAIVE